MLHAHLFGGLALEWDGDPLPAIPSGVARSLLAYLITYRDRPHTRDLLAGTFWPDLPDAVARRRLRQVLWQIRHALNPHPVLVTEGDSVQFNPNLPLWLDVEEFTSHQPPGTGTDAEAIAHDESCLEQYRGEFLAGYYDDWIVVERERLREILLQVLRRLVAGTKGRGDYERALAYARRLASEDPWREEAHREVMRLCHLLGRTDEALRQYDICRQVLAEDLGSEPSPETAALAAEMAARSGPPQSLLLPARARPATAPFLERPDLLPLVGRQQELAELLYRVEAAVAGRGGLTLLYGEAGVGKSRLLRELADNVRWRGVRALWGRCYDLAAPPAYQPLVEALRGGLPALAESALPPLWRAELSRLLPDLATGEGPPPPLSKEEQKRRLLEAIARGFLTLAEAGFQLLLVEDAHWIDLASLEALRYLLPRLDAAPLLVVMAARPEELATPVASGLSAMEGTRLPRRMALERLNPTETEELVKRALDLERPAPRFSARLHAETEGNPFFLVETLRTLIEEGLLFCGDSGAWSTPWDESTQDYAELPLPAGVVQSIERRLARLPAALTELLNLAATIGRWPEFTLWLAVSGREEEELLAAGDDLCARGLLLATTSGATAGADYAFAHDLIRRVAYERLAGPRRRLYHRRVAEALTRLSAEITARDAPEALAYHWTQAEEWDKAADCHWQAGERARKVYAHAEAMDHYSQALKALERLPGPPDPARAFELRLAREAEYDWQGERAAQAQELAALAALSRDLDAGKRAEVALRRAAYATATGDFPAAIAAACEAIDEAHTAQDRRQEAMAYLQWGKVLWHQGAYGPARARLEHALTLAKEAQLSPVVADSRLGLGRVFLSQGDYASAGAHFTQALDFYGQAGDLRGQAEALETLGSASHVQGDYGEARTDVEQALRISRQIGDRQSESRALHRLGSVAINQGEHATAQSYLESALHIAGEIGDRGLESSLLTTFGVLANRRCEYRMARAHLKHALEIGREIGDRRGEGIVLTNLGIVLYCLGDYEQATAYAEEAQQIGLEIGDRRYQGWALHTLGRIATQQARYARAEICYEQARQISQEIGDRQLEGLVLSTFSLLAHQLGDDGAALEHAQQALRIVETIGEPVDTGYAWTGLGHALAGLGCLDEAANAYRQAVEVRRKLGQYNLATEPQAGLARLALSQGEVALAQSHVEEILHYLETGTLDGAEEGLQVYLTCYRVLNAAHDPRAGRLLSRAHDLLQERAAVSDDRSLLENVTVHREIMAAWRERQAAQQIYVRLPRSDAPLGRPLRDDEVVMVAWTVAAVEDETIVGKVARRHKRLLRLLEEAQTQGATPSQWHLAAALGVSQRTVERDMARLGERPPTRGKMSA